jgi:urease accessory protein
MRVQVRGIITMGMGMTIPTAMADAALVRLFSWLSPAFPIGGFAYSQGLETAIVDGRVTDTATLIAWIAGQLHAGSIRNDAYFLAMCARAVGTGDAEAIAEANALALALQSSRERDAETREQAVSFLLAARAWPIAIPDWLTAILDAPMTLPTAFGTMAGLHDIDADTAVAGFLNAYASQQISVAVRLVPLGQTEGLAALVALEAAIVALARSSRDAQIGDIGAIGYGTDIASMRHETLTTRIFRS